MRNDDEPMSAPEAKSETHQEASKRRSLHLAALQKTHMDNINLAHAMYPTPVGVPFHVLSEQHKLAWNERRKVIDSANKAYYNAVKKATEGHRAEEKAIHDAVNSRMVEEAA